MKVLLLGMSSEFEDMYSTSGIVKYISHIYSDLKDMKNMEVEKLEYKKLARKFPFVNHFGFYLESRFTDFSKYQIIHNMNGLRLFGKPKGKLVVTIYDFMPYYDRIKIWGNKGQSKLVAMNSWFSDYMAVIGFKMALNADAILVLNEKGKEELIDFAKKNNKEYDSNKIHIIGFAVDDKFITEPIKEKEKSTPFRVGYLGSFSKQKRVDILIRAVKSIDKQDIKVELWGSRSIQSRDLDTEIGNDKRIQLMNLAPEEKKIDIYDSFDVFVDCSIWESLMMYEALARGLPVIIVRGGKINPDLAMHCIEVGNEKELADAILDLKVNGYNPEKRKQAMAYVGQFTWKKLAERVAKVYDDVLSQ